MPRGSVRGGDRLRLRSERGRFIYVPGGAVRIFDQIGPRLDIGPEVAVEGAEATLEFYADQIEEWMRENAPWDDRSGEARDGLTAEVDRHRMQAALYVYHTVDYGIWLEVRWNGKYAILTPAVEHWGPFVMQELEIF